MLVRYVLTSQRVMNVAETLESRYLPLLNGAAARLREKHPTFRFNVGSGSVGSLTTFQGHNVYLEASRDDAKNDRVPNCVAVEFCVRDLPGHPTLCSLGVSWGGDGVPPSEGLDLLPSEVAFGSKALALIDDAMPQLEKHFDSCLYAWEAAYPQST
jgi:hypothetical protein